MNLPASIKSGIWPFLLLPGLLLVPTLFFSWDRIESDVADNANAVLKVDHAWATAEAYNRGRDVIIIGTAPDAEAAQSALAILASADGVRRADFAGVIAPPMMMPRLNVQVSEREIKLAGIVDNPATVNQLVESASRSFPGRRIANLLKEGDHVAKLPEMRNVLAAARALPAGTEIELQDGVLRVAAQLQDQQGIDAFSAILNQGFDGEIVNQLRLAPPDPNVVCQERVNSLLSQANIVFESARSKILDESMPLLDQISTALGECPQIRFEISGHTDSIGDAGFNKMLSEARAGAVREYILEKTNLEANRLVAVGNGSERPIASNQTSTGRAQNRRIEIKIIDSEAG